jgi:HEAT repeat protein
MPLLNLLRDADAEVRKAAILALGATGDRLAITGIMATLQTGDDQMVRTCAIALENLGDPMAIPILKTVSTVVEGTVKEAVLRAVAKLTVRSGG